MSYPNYGGNGGQPYDQYGYAPGYNNQYAQPYQATPPQIRNPFAPPPAATSTYSGQASAYDPEYEQQVAEWNSAYAPPEQQDRMKKGGKPGQDGNATATYGSRGANVAGGVTENADTKGSGRGGKDQEKTVIRRGGGETWEDKSLLEWDPTQFRIMVGNLAGEVTDESLAKAFAQYDVSKARVVRDKRTTKSKGYGFVSFTDSELGFKAAREMVGKYIGSHPVTIQRSKTNITPVVKKDHNKHKGKNNRNNKDKGGKNRDDPLKAHTGAGIEKKPVKHVGNAGLKLLG